MEMPRSFGRATAGHLAVRALATAGSRQGTGVGVTALALRLALQRYKREPGAAQHRVAQEFAGSQNDQPENAIHRRFQKHVLRGHAGTLRAGGDRRSRGGRAQRPQRPLQQQQQQHGRVAAQRAGPGPGGPQGVPQVRE